MTKKARPPNLAYRNAFALRLRQVREEAGLSQEALANKIEMSRRYLSGIERGEGNPTLDLIALIAEVLAVAPADLMPPLARSSRSKKR